MTQSTHDHETLDIFRQFLEIAPFSVAPGSARLETPPKPDASCIRDGELCYFELVRPVDPGVAEHIAGLVRAAERSPVHMAPGDAITSVLGAGFFEAIDRKERKRYDTGDAALELLIWIDRRVDPFVDGAWQHIRDDFMSVIDAYRGRWRTVWVFDPVDNVILLPEPRPTAGRAHT